jgi:enoyl-CoA hydratase/carnithine racemase
MAHQDVVFERDGAVEWITLNRPDRMNALTPDLVQALADRLAEMRDDASLRVVVLRGAGRAFCAGLDIKAKAERDAVVAAGGADDDRLPDLMHDIVLGLHTCPAPVIALLNGPVAGGGFAMALAADIRVATPSTFMKISTLPLGMTSCELGVSYFLPRYVGVSVASELMLTDRRIAAERAQQLGLISQIVPEDGLDDAARVLISEMLRATPLGLRSTKKTFQRSLGLTDLEAVLDLERAAQDECLVGPHFQEGLAAFIEKRTPNFE